MATAIGFRVDPKKVTYAVVTATADGKFAVTNVGEVLVPYALDIPRRLAFIRTALLDIIEEAGSTRAGLRIGESMARKKDPFRLNLEGVVQELLVSSDIERFLSGQIATISSLLGESDRKVIKEFVAGTKPRHVESGWDDLDAIRREAVLVAICAALSDPPLGAEGALTQ